MAFDWPIYLLLVPIVPLILICDIAKKDITISVNTPYRAKTGLSADTVQVLAHYDMLKRILPWKVYPSIYYHRHSNAILTYIFRTSFTCSNRWIEISKHRLTSSLEMDTKIFAMCSLLCPSVWEHYKIRVFLYGPSPLCRSHIMYHAGWPFCIYTGIIQCMRSADKIRRYIVTSSLIGWAYTQNDAIFV